MSNDIDFSIIARDRASSTFSNVGRAAERSGGALSQFAGYAKKAIGALALYEGAKKAAEGLKSLTEAAAEDQKSQALLAKQYQNSAKATKAQISATEKWITTVGKAKGVTDDELRPALGNLVTATHNVRKAQQLATLAMDIATAKGKPLSAVSIALAKAYNGNVGALGRLGIATTDASGKTLTFTQVQQQLTDQFGGAAATKADTFAGKMDRLKVVFQETKESLGAKLLPVLTNLTDWALNSGVPKIEAFVKQMQTGKGAGGELAGTIKSIVDAGKPLAGVLKGGLTQLASDAKKIAAAFNSLPSGIQKLIVAGGATAAVGAKLGLLKPLIGAATGKGAAGTLAGKAGVVPVFVTNKGFGSGGGVPDVLGGAGGAAKGAATGEKVLTTFGLAQILKTSLPRLFSLPSLAVGGFTIGGRNAEVRNPTGSESKLLADARANPGKYVMVGGQIALKSQAEKWQKDFTQSVHANVVAASVAAGDFNKTLKGVPDKKIVKIGTEGGPQALADIAALARAQHLTNTQIKILLSTAGLPSTLGDIENVNRAADHAARARTLRVTVTANTNALLADVKAPPYPGGRDGNPKTPYPRALGGPVQAGTPYIVGERRPELFVPNQSGRILPSVPNGGGTVINITVNGAMDPTAVGKQMVQVLTQYKNTLGGRQLGIA